MLKLNREKLIVMSMLLAAVVAILISQSEASEYPSPPPVPSKFDNPEEVQKYLQQLHNYYLIVGRPRSV